jgi:hypothetical protein
MCKSFLCEIYQLELKGARKRLGNIRKLKREHGIDAIDIEVENVKQCIVTAKAKIDDLHMELVGIDIK